MRWAILAIFLAGTTGCKTTDLESEVKIREGIKAEEVQHRAVVMLNFDDGRFCTATYVNETVLITAAHCFFDDNFIYSKPKINGIEVASVLMADRKFADSYRKLKTDLLTLKGSNIVHQQIVEFTKRDIAVISAPETPASSFGIGGADFPQLRAPGTSLENAPVTMVGYGLTGTTNGEKFYGYNKIDALRDGVILMMCGSENQVSASDTCADRGDSGGALLLEGGPLTGDESLVGIISFNPPGGYSGYSYFADLGSDIASAMFDAAMVAGFEPIPVPLPAMTIPATNSTP